MKKTQNKISVETIEFHPFNRLQLKKIHVADLKKDTLLYIENLNAAFNLWKLWDRKLLIHSVEIDDFRIHVSKEQTDSLFNYQFLIDAFSPDSTQSSGNSKLEMDINRICLKNGRLQYDIFSEPILELGRFDDNHIAVHNFQATIRLHSIAGENPFGSIENLSFDEKCGFTLSQMRLRIKKSETCLRIDDFYLALPHSEITIQEANLDYTDRESSEILKGATYSIFFTSGKIHPDDVHYFYPPLVGLTETLICSGEINGRFPAISLPHFQADYGDYVHLNLSANIANFQQWETSAFNLNMDNCFINPKLFKPSVHLDTLSITGKITGALPNLKLALNGKSGQGDWILDGAGSYNVPSANAAFDLNVETLNLNVKSLLADTTFGNASFRLSAQGTLNGANKIDARAQAEIRRLDYRGYGYRAVSATATYANDSISLNLNSKDANLPLTFHAQVGLDKKNSFAQAYAKLNKVRLDSLHLLSPDSGAELSGGLTLFVKGFNPESMALFATVDSFGFVTRSGSFNDSSIRFSYNAEAGGQKQINWQSSVLNLRGKGRFTYDGFNQSIQQAFPTLFPTKKYKTEKGKTIRETFNFFLAIRQANAFSHLLGMEAEIPDSAFFVGKYTKDEEDLNLNVTAFCLFSQTDTAQVQLNLSHLQNKLAVRLDVKNNSTQYDLEGNLGAEIEFIPNSKKTIPNMQIALNPGSVTLNGTSFRIYPAQIKVMDAKTEINNFALRHSTSEYLKINGIVSGERSDSLLFNINRFEVGTILSALKYKIPFSGTASGDVTLSQLTTNPLIFTRNLTIDNLVFDEHPIGNLQLRSAWNSERQGLGLRATLNNTDSSESVVSGFVLPGKDSLSLTANLKGIQLKWFAGYLPESVYDLEGELGARMKIDGRITAPALSGSIYLQEATVGVKTLNTHYRISDSIFFEKDYIDFRNFIVYDETKRNAKINGSIHHKWFSNMNPQLTVDFNNFLLLNNAGQTDSLFYGLVRVNGNLNVVSQHKDWLVQGRLSNGKANEVMMNIPETPTEAQRYNWLTFVNTEKTDSVVVVKPSVPKETTAFSLPLKLQITCLLDENLSVGAIINPETNDAAVVTGHGTLDFSYNLNNLAMNLLGTYVIDDGKCTLSLKNITKKTFVVRPGGKLNFQGDPMNTRFDLTAMYSLRAYLTGLDPSFANIATASKIPVNCLLTASGKMENMQLKYEIALPNQPDEIQRKLDGLIYTDDIKIKEIAYLLAFGSFLPVNSNSLTGGNSSIWTSLASSSITSQLNNLLSGILKDNWTIGTDLHSNDANFSDVDMDVNISTRLFNDRLTVNSTLGYHNNPVQSGNFTGDFDFEYKLSPNGNVLLQFYNIANHQYYDKSRASMTQGLGIVYKREGRTFRQLFRSFGTKKK